VAAGVYREGWRVELVAPRRVALVPIEEPDPQPDEVLVATTLSLISVGTELALYEGRPNAATRFPRPLGYCNVGRVVAAGHQAPFLTGQLVATEGPHGTLHRTQARQALPVPPDVSPELAAMSPLGAVALQSIRRSRYGAGSSTVVIGAGLVGQLISRLATIAGADSLLAVRSPARLHELQRAGVDGALLADMSGGDARTFDVVFDATGDPQAMDIALDLVNPGGQIVLVGSSRGVSRAIDWDRLRDRSATLVGAHTSTLPRDDRDASTWDLTRERALFLEYAASGLLEQHPPISEWADPSSAPALYASLARTSQTPVGVAFNWAEFDVGTNGSRGTSALATAAQQNFEAVTPGQPLRWGIVGCGEAALEYARLMTESPLHTVDAAYDSEPQRARLLVLDRRPAESLDALLDDPALEVVMVSTPHHLHSAIALRCIQAGKHVVVEKPCGVSVDGCEQVVRAAEKAGVVVTVTYSQRFDDRLQIARRLIDRGVLGTLTRSVSSLTISRSQAYFEVGRTGRFRSSWRRDIEQAGGGALIMNGTHLLADLFWLTGSPSAHVTATASTEGDNKIEHTLASVFEHRCGALGLLEVTTNQTAPVPQTITLTGTMGQLVVGDKVRYWSERPVLGNASRTWHTIEVDTHFTDKGRFLDAVFRSVRESEQPPVLPSEAVEVLRFVAAAYGSLRGG
jgi:2-desacetyl-2-hydroxyethyl bacteriochlorophyllide A dehydrogenase